jgi:hypothetical protein
MELVHPSPYYIPTQRTLFSRALSIYRVPGACLARAWRVDFRKIFP